MQLSQRLKAVADYVEKGSLVADIGCDHAYTSIYLIQNNIASHIIAMDINKGPLEKAKANIQGYGLSGRIETRLSDGMEKLCENEVDTVLISGMGGALITNILTKRLDIVTACKSLILQPQSEIHLVRRFLHEHHFKIAEETMLVEEGKYYVVIHAVPGGEVYQKEAEYQYGKFLLVKKDSTLKSFLNKEKTVLENIKEELKMKDTEHTKKRLGEIEAELDTIKEAFSFF